MHRFGDSESNTKGNKKNNGDKNNNNNNNKKNKNIQRNRRFLEVKNNYNFYLRKNIQFISHTFLIYIINYSTIHTIFKNVFY